LEFGGEALVLTHDTMVEGVHFLSGQSDEDLAWKLVASNMSDLAAKGAQPLGVLLSYQLGGDDPAFLRGFQAALRHYGNAAVLGGDTVPRAPDRQGHGSAKRAGAARWPAANRKAGLRALLKPPEKLLSGVALRRILPIETPVRPACGAIALDNQKRGSVR
jgi:thiamine-monophosphate kinase